MQTNVSIAEGVYLIGVNDRRTALFENIWPIPYGVSYNSYLIRDDKCALLDTVEFGSEGAYLDRIEEILGERELDYLVVNHMEPDHSGEIGTVLKRYPSVTPWVHWPETMMTYESTEKILFSADAFGTFGATDGAMTDALTDLAEYREEMRRYYSNIVGKYGGMVQKALAKLSSLDVKTLCSLHGPVWSRQAGEVIGLYDKWSRCEADEEAVIIYASMYNNTAHMANHIADRMAERGVTGVKVYDVSKTHLSYLISEIWRCRYVMLGSCAYNADMFPLMELLCNSMLHYGLKNRELAIFGSCSFGGGGVRSLRKFAEASGWELMCEPVEVTGTATPANLAKFEPLADAVAERIKAGRK